MGNLDNEVSVKRIIHLIRKRIWIIIVSIIVFTSFGGLYSVFFTNPLYESSTRMIVNAEPDLMNTLMVMIKEPSFLEKVIVEMELDQTPEELSKQITAGSIENSSIVRISVIDTNPELAAKIADTTASVFKKEIPRLLDFNDISVFSKANISSLPINDNQTKIILIGFLIGLITGVGVIFLFDFMDNTVSSERNIEQLLGIPVLGSISKMDKETTSQAG